MMVFFVFFYILYNLCVLYKIFSVYDIYVNCIVCCKIKNEKKSFYAATEIEYKTRISVKMFNFIPFVCFYLKYYTQVWGKIIQEKQRRS
jgi:hypothetical protein